MDESWDWEKMIPVWEYHDIWRTGFPEWEKDEDGPAHILFRVVKGLQRSSREIAIEWDGLAEGEFYYRDITQSGIPFVRDGAAYKSLFVFQYRRDLEKFKRHFAFTH